MNEGDGKRAVVFGRGQRVGDAVLCESSRGTGRGPAGWAELALAVPVCAEQTLVVAQCRGRGQTSDVERGLKRPSHPLCGTFKKIELKIMGVLSLRFIRTPCMKLTKMKPTLYLP